MTPRPTRPAVEPGARTRPGETYGKLLVVLDQLAREAVRLDDDAIREGLELPQLDAIDLGEQLGLLSDVEAAGRRARVLPAMGPGDRCSAQRQPRR